MASISSEHNGRRRVQFVAGDGSRKTIRLGKVTQRQADTFRVKVEALTGASITGSFDDETSRWVAALDERMHARLAAVGLVAARLSARSTTLGPFTQSYIDGRTDVKPNTVIGMKAARRNLVAFFGESKRLSDITAGDAEEYWRYLVGKLSPNTARRMCGRAKQFFRFAVRKRIIRDNPFTDLETNVRSNPERQFFVTREMATKVIDACPDAEWRLLFGLSRYGGLRCPSEHLAITWADVDWERGRIRVPSPKMEHIEGRASRVIPLFPELRPLLLDVFEQAEAGAVHVITRYRVANTNLRTQLMRIIKRAGLEPWPKLFHNLRATRQTELTEATPGHVVCAGLGNTPAVARAHYLQVTDAHYLAAAALPEKATQNPTQQPAVSTRSDSQVERSTNENRPVLPGDAKPSETVREKRWPLSESNRYALAGTGF